MESSIENFFHNNIIFPNDVKRRLNTIRSIDDKLEIKKEHYEQLKAQLTGTQRDNELFNEIEQVYLGK